MMEDVEIDRKDKLVKQAFSYELKFLIPVSVLCMICPFCEIFICESGSCPNFVNLGFLVSLIILGVVCVGFMLYRAISYSSLHQATIGMRKVGIYATRQDKTKYTLFSALYNFIPTIFLCGYFGFSAYIVPYLGPYIKNSTLPFHEYFSTAFSIIVLVIYFILTKEKVQTSRFFIGHK